MVGPSGHMLLCALQIFLISILDEMGHISATSGHPASALHIVCASAEVEHLLHALDLLSTC